MASRETLLTGVVPNRLGTHLHFSTGFDERLAQQPIRKQCHKLLGLLVYVAGRTSNELHNAGTVTQAAVATAVSNVALAQAIALTDPNHSQQLIEGLTAHLTDWQTEDAEGEYQKRLCEVLELVTQALCCVNKDDDWSRA